MRFSVFASSAVAAIVGFGGTGGYLPGTKDARPDGKEAPREEKRPKEEKPTGKEVSRLTNSVQVWTGLKFSRMCSGVTVAGSRS